MSATKVVVSCNTLSHVAGAFFLKKYATGYEPYLFETPELTEELLNSDHLLIVGNLFREKYGSFTLPQVTVFADKCDHDTKASGIKWIAPQKEFTGFLAYVQTLIKEKNEKITTFIQYLDTHLCGYPGETELNFQAGIWRQEGKTSYDKFAYAYEKVSVQDLIEQGAIARSCLKATIDDRVAKSKVVIITSGECKYKVRVAYGYIPVTDTLFALLNEEVHCAMLIGHNLKTNQTDIRIKTSRGLHAGVIAKKLYGGGGYAGCGGATIDGILHL